MCLIKLSFLENFLPHTLQGALAGTLLRLSASVAMLCSVV